MLNALCTANSRRLLLAIARQSLVCQSSWFSTTNRVSRIYEYRTYDIKPQYYGEFMKVVDEVFHLRTAHSKPLGVWTVEYGGLNQFVHMWPYDNHGHRTAVRSGMVEDKEWMTEFVAKVFPMFEKMTNVVLHPFPWYNIVEKPALDEGVYEMRRHVVLPGKLEQFSHRFQQGVESRNKYSQLIGIWYSEFGQLNQVYHLWHYRSPDDRERVRKEAEKDEMWSETIRDCKLLLSSMESKLLLPVRKHSPWK